MSKASQISPKDIIESEDLLGPGTLEIWLEKFTRKNELEDNPRYQNLQDEDKKIQAMADQFRAKGIKLSLGEIMDRLDIDYPDEFRDSYYSTYPD